MSEAPERVRLEKSVGGRMCDFGDADGIEYIRADLVDATRREARNEALREARARIGTVAKSKDGSWRLGRSGYSNPTDAMYDAITAMIEDKP